MAIKLYWWRGEGATDHAKQNFGDFLSPLIVEMASGKKVEYADPKNADMIAIGSILSRERKAKGLFFKRQLHIWGSGTDSAERSFSARHYYHAVRGVETRQQIQGPPTHPALGDPGLLADRWWSGRPRPEKKFRLGIIPHFVDQHDSSINDLGKLPRSTIINVFDTVDKVIHDIQQCDFIISSSMHGLIIADAFGIPNRRLIMSTGIISNLKFVDYYSAFGMDEPVPTTAKDWLEGNGDAILERQYSRPGLESIKDKLLAAFPSNL